MTAEATILHADADAFFASVEQRDDPALRGRPVIVGVGVVMAASYEARARGVRGGMGGARARRLCPGAVFVQPRFSAYVEAGKSLRAVFEEASPVVEPLSMEEAFLEVAGLERIRGSPAEIAAWLRREARARVGLPVTVGVARTKALAKMASRAAKPDGLLVVPPERELAFLHPLPVERLWGVGPASARKLRVWGVETVGDAAELAESTLVAILGRAAGRHVHALVQNRDPRPVRRGRRRRSFGAQSALGRRRRSRAAVEAILAGLVDRVTRRMRRSGGAGRTVVLRLRFDDFTRATRSCTLSRPTAATHAVLAAARALLAAAMPTIERRGLTLIGVAVTNLDERDAGVQLELPLDGRMGDALDSALDEVRDRFGTAAVTRAALIGPRLAATLASETIASVGVPTAVRNFLAERHPAELELSLWVRQAVLSAEPDLTERVYPGWDGVGFRHPEGGYVCAIYPRDREVRLLFEHGARLDDSQGLLRGDGTQTRYVAVRSRDVRLAEQLGALVREAVAERVLRR